MQDIVHPLVLCATGAPNLLEGMLHDCEQCPGKSSPCFRFSMFCDREGLDGMSSLISDGISCISVLPLIL